MVNNSTNINKTNNHLSPEESLNSDGQQFHQYQQMEQLPFYTTYWAYKIPRLMMLEIQMVAWDRHKNVTVVKPANGITPTTMHI